MKNTAFHYLNIQYSSTGNFKALEEVVVAAVAEVKEPLLLLVVWVGVVDDACGIYVHADVYNVSCAWFVLR